ncbi:MAG: methyltransferase domain-containing protein [Chloroflexota bacterium]|nr:MAG: SAM-dependent methyltransferase [Chloroflexota bacterium]
MRPLVKTLVPKRYHHLVKRVYLKMTTALYAGDQVMCPCCKGQFRAFLPAGRNGRLPNSRCPGCGSLKRHRLQWLYFQERTNLFVDNLRVLHIAPEYALQKRLRALPNLEYISGDLDSPLAQIKLDVARMQFADDTFDVILCNHVLEHVPDDCRAMRELCRVLKPGGWAIIQSPVDMRRATTFEDWSVTSPKERERLFGQDDHVRVYGRDYKDRLEAAGFTVTLDDFAQTCSEETARRYGIRRDEIIYRCTKERGRHR